MISEFYTRCVRTISGLKIFENLVRYFLKSSLSLLDWLFPVLKTIKNSTYSFDFDAEPKVLSLELQFQNSLVTIVWCKMLKVYLF